MNELIEDINDGLVDSVYVYKLDRISRSQKDTLYLIEEVFNKNEVGFVSIRESFDTTTPFGKAMIGILSVFAQLERETILERTKLGLYKRAEEGLWRGGGHIPFPYNYDSKSGILVPDSEKVKVFHKMVSLYLSGLSYRRIGSIIGMDEKQVERRLLSRTNLGIVPYNDLEFKGQHEAVIDDETYEKILETNKIRSKKKYMRRYLLSGKIYCGDCGAKYRYQKWGKRTICYCYSQQKSKPEYIKDDNCVNKKWETFEVEDAVLSNIFSMSLDEKLFEQNFYLTEVSIIDEYNKRITIINSKLDNLINFISEGLATNEISEKIKKLEEERESILEEIKKIKSRKEKNSKSFELIKNLENAWNYMEFAEQRTIIEQIVDKVVLINNTIKIYYRIA